MVKDLLHWVLGGVWDVMFTYNGVHVIFCFFT